MEKHMKPGELFLLDNKLYRFLRDSSNTLYGLFGEIVIEDLETNERFYWNKNAPKFNKSKSICKGKITSKCDDCEHKFLCFTRNNDE